MQITDAYMLSLSLNVSLNRIGPPADAHWCRLTVERWKWGRTKRLQRALQSLWELSRGSPIEGGQQILSKRKQCQKNRVRDMTHAAFKKGCIHKHQGFIQEKKAHYALITSWCRKPLKIYKKTGWYVANILSFLPTRRQKKKKKYFSLKPWMRQGTGVSDEWHNIKKNKKNLPVWSLLLLLPASNTADTTLNSAASIPQCFMSLIHHLHCPLLCAFR